MSRAGGKDRGLFEKVPGSGVWWIRYAGADGKEHREKAGTKSQAKILYTKRQAAKLQGQKLPETLRKRALTVEGLIERYRPVFEAKASASHDARYAKYWVEALGSHAVDEVIPRDIERWREKRLLECAPSTVNRAVAFLQQVYNRAIRDGLFNGANPAATVGMLRENNKRIRYLTDIEESRLKEAMKPRYWPFVEIAFLTGMRRGEQFNLRRENVCFLTGTLTIPKSKDGEKRFVHLGPRGMELFRQLLGSHDSEWVFPSPLRPGTPRSGKGIEKILRRALVRSKINDFHWHDLRHTFGSRLAMEGVELQVIRDLMGHGSVRMTERYAHLCPSHLKKAVANL